MVLWTASKLQVTTLKSIQLYQTTHKKANEWAIYGIDWISPLSKWISSQRNPMNAFWFMHEWKNCLYQYLFDASIACFYWNVLKKPWMANIY